MTSAALNERLSFRDDRPVKVKLPLKAELWEVILVGVWLCATATVKDGLEPLRYSCMLVFIGSMAYYRSFLLPFISKSWFVFLFPLWVIFSVFWSPSSAALRFGAMHFLDVLIILYIAFRLHPQQIVRALFYGYLPISLLVFMHLPELSRNSMPDGFAEKNMVGNRMFFVYVSSLFIVLNKRFLKAERVLGLVLLLPSFYAIFIVESATNLALSIVATFVLILMATVWKLSSKIQSGRMILIVSASILVGLGSIILAMSSLALSELVLGALDKDVTLTGRTEIWAHAKDVYLKHPLFGIGAEGFWQLGSGKAELILQEFGKAEGDRFSFHNSYLEILVHLGIVGLLFVAIPLAYVIYRNIAMWIKHQDLIASFFVLMCVCAFARFMTESDLYNVFEINKIMMFLSGFYALAYRKARVVQRNL